MNWWLKRFISLTFVAQVFVLELEKKNNQWELKNNFHTYKTHFYFFFYLDPSYFQSSYLFHFFFIWNDLKCYKSATLSPKNNLGVVIIIKQHTRNILGLQELAMVCCFEFLTPPTLGGHNFLIFNLFLIIFSALDVPRGGAQHLLGQ